MSGMWFFTDIYIYIYIIVLAGYPQKNGFECTKVGTYEN